MKKILFVFFSLFVCSASYACPDLSGMYLCPKTNYHPDLFYSFARTPKDENWLFSMETRLTNRQLISSFQFLTDGEEHDVADGVSGKHLLVEAKCTDSELVVSGSSNSESTAPILFSEVLSLTNEGNLSDVSKTADGGTLEEICVRTRN